MTIWRQKRQKKLANGKPKINTLWRTYALLSPLQTIPSGLQNRIAIGFWRKLLRNATDLTTYKPYMPSTGGIGAGFCQIVYETKPLIGAVFCDGYRSGMKYQIQHNGHTITYEVVYAKRKTLEIRIHPDLQVVVKAPSRTPHAFIDGLVQKRADWILTKQHQIAQAPRPHAIQYISGEKHFFLGRDYELAVIATTRRSSVYIDDNRLIIQVSDPSDSARVKKVLEGWIRKQAHTLFSERIAIALERFENYPLPPFDWKIKLFKARWGSCSSTRVVTLNLHLMRLELALIDYVIVHELCHLHEMNHGRGFYALMDATMPDWKHRRKLLKAHRLS